MARTPNGIVVTSNVPGRIRERPLRHSRQQAGRWDAFASMMVGQTWYLD